LPPRQRSLEPQTWRATTVSALVCGFFFIALSFWHQQKFNGPTPVSRLDLLHAIVENHQFTIDPFEQNTCDKAVYQGHYYSDKAPGTVILALPFFYLAEILVGKDIGGPESSKKWLISSWISCAGALGLTTALGAACLFRWLCKWTTARVAFLTTMALFLGGMPLPYATILFSHSLVVGLISVSLWAIGWSPASAAFAVRNSSYDIVAGLCCGLSVACEFTAGLIVIGVSIGLLVSDSRRFTRFVVATIPPLLLIPAYSLACFGHAFVLPYSLQAAFPEMQQGFYSITWPNAAIAWNLLFGSSRGLLFWSPFLLLSGLGYGRLIKRSEALFWLTYLLPLVQIFVLSGRAFDWHGGPTFSARYLAPILPWLALPCALGAERFTKTACVLTIYSIGVTTLATVTNACPEIYANPNPLFDLDIPLFLKGQFSPNLGAVLGVNPYLSVALYYSFLVGGAFWLWHLLGKDPAREDPASPQDRRQGFVSSMQVGEVHLKSLNG
jgi:hypothetical protein